MKPIILKERVPVIAGYEDKEDVWSYERIMELWGEDSDELTPVLARRCKELEEKLGKTKTGEYLIFGGLTYYPQGGGRDLLDRCHNKEEAFHIAESLLGKEAVTNIYDEDDYDSFTINWTHVMSPSGLVIKKFGKGYGIAGRILKIIP